MIPATVIRVFSFYISSLKVYVISILDMYYNNLNSFYCGIKIHKYIHTKITIIPPSNYIDKSI